MRPFRIGIMLIGASLVALWPGAALAGGGRGGGACDGFSSGDRLVMRDSCFEGVAHFVDASSTLLVVNAGAAPHSLTAVDGSFDTGTLSSGGKAEIPLKTTGIVRVYCTLHGTKAGGGMAGVLIVGDPTASAARPAAATTLGSRAWWSAARPWR